FGGLLVLDEAYIEFSSGKSWLDSLLMYPNLIVTRTFSKAYGMAGIRLGICWASTEIISLLNRIKPPYNVNELTQKAALDRLLDIKSVSEQLTTILEQRASLIDQLKKIPFVKKVFPTDANFILVKVDDAGSRYQKILDRGIVIRNRSSLPLCENTLRFTVGTVEENKELIEVLKSI
ncbi:MAG: aminotransferase class I/II-fold pyridoxal phosphate-dependent enzyme, partial [Flavobacteriaceae bacterium]